MKQLFEYINQLFLVYDCGRVVDKKMLLPLETKINEYIFKNYNKIKKQKYVSIVFEKSSGELKTHILSEFEKELEEHYPERLI